MNALTVQKKLLIVESELNRIQLAAGRAVLHSDLHIITHGVSAVGAIASSASMLATNLAAIPRKQHAAGTKRSRLQIILSSAVLISSIWLALIPRKN